jgi:hypothetical protein
MLMTLAPLVNLVVLLLLLIQYINQQRSTAGTA